MVLKYVDVLHSVPWMPDSLDVKIHSRVFMKDASGYLAWKNWRYDITINSKFFVFALVKEIVYYTQFEFFIFSSTMSSLDLVALLSHCLRIQSFPHVRYLSFMGWVAPIDRRPCSLLSATMSQVFPPCRHLQVYGHQDCTLMMEPDSNCLAMISPDIITVSVHSLVTKLQIMWTYFLADPHLFSGM